MVIHLKNNNKFSISKILEAYKSKNGLQKVAIFSISKNRYNNVFVLLSLVILLFLVLLLTHIGENAFN